MQGLFYESNVHLIYDTMVSHINGGEVHPNPVVLQPFRYEAHYSSVLNPLEASSQALALHRVLYHIQDPYMSVV